MPRPRNPKSNFFYLLDSTQQPIYVLDQNHRILFANESFAKWVNIAREDLEQVRCSGNATTGTVAVESLVRGLAILPENQSLSNFTQLVFLAPNSSPLEKRLARVQKLDDLKGSSGWLVTVANSDLYDADESTTKNLVAQLAQLIHESLPTRLPAAAIGTSLIARRVKRQIEIASLGQADFTISGPAGSDGEQLAKFVFRQFPNSNGQTLTPINCLISDQVSIQETIRRLSRNQTAVATGEKLRRVDWLLLVDVEKLDSAAAMELDGFLELPRNRIGLMATSATPIDQLTTDGSFPPSLLARLSALAINLPALTERRDDLPLIFRNLLEEAAANHKRALPSVPASTIEAILEYTWPGNLEEMQESIERFFGLEKSEIVGAMFQPEDFPERIRLGIKHGRLGRANVESIDLGSRMQAIEREFIERALLRAKFNRSKAAKDLGISRTKLLRRCEQLSIQIPEGPIDFEIAETPEFDEAE